MLQEREGKGQNTATYDYISLQNSTVTFKASLQYEKFQILQIFSNEAYTIIQLCHSA